MFIEKVNLRIGIPRIMATGVGEASAILTVAQIGIKLSHILTNYVGELKDAQNRIRQMGSEIATTSHTLNQIGDLVKRNPLSDYPTRKAFVALNVAQRSAL